MKLQLAVSQIAVVAPGEEKTHAVYAAGGDLLGQMQGTSEPAPAPEKPAEMAQPQPHGLQGQDGPEGRPWQAPGQQAANIKKLEEAAATGNHRATSHGRHGAGPT